MIGLWRPFRWLGLILFSRGVVLDSCFFREKLVVNEKFRDEKLSSKYLRNWRSFGHRRPLSRRTLEIDNVPLAVLPANTTWNGMYGCQLSPRIKYPRCENWTNYWMSRSVGSLTTVLEFGRHLQNEIGSSNSSKWYRSPNWSIICKAKNAKGAARTLAPAKAARRSD